MSKHTVTMKSLIDENRQLKMELHNAEIGKDAYRQALKDYKARGFWARVFDVFCIKGGAE